MNKNFKILMIGPQMCGKGTQAQAISEKLGVPYFAMGNLFRQRAQKQDELGKEIAELMNNATLVQDEVANKIIFEKLSEDECKAGYILDGYPRNMNQAEFFDKHDSFTHVFEIYISNKEAKRRFLGRRTCKQCQTVYHLEYNPPKEEGVCNKCGGELVIRDDETEKALDKRLQNYYKLTAPIIEFYKEKKVHHQINGEQGIRDVTRDILDKLEN